MLTYEQIAHLSKDKVDFQIAIRLHQYHPTYPPYSSSIQGMIFLLNMMLSDIQTSITSIETFAGETMVLIRSQKVIIETKLSPEEIAKAFLYWLIVEKGK